jgi:hypothetical protein
LGVGLEGEGGYDAEGCAGAAQGPEEVGVRGGGACEGVSGGEDDGRGEEVVYVEVLGLRMKGEGDMPITSPYFPLRYPYPPPSVSPPTPVWFTVPPTVASPYLAASMSTSSQSVPPSATMVLASGSTVTLRILERSMTSPSSIEAAPDVEWPPPRTVKGMLCSRISERVTETSDVEVTRTTAA